MKQMSVRSKMLLIAAALGLIAADGCARERSTPNAGAAKGSAATPVSETDVPGALVADAELSIARATHQMIALEDGRLLVVGGCGGESCETVHKSAEIYDPKRRAFAPTGGMSEARSGHAAVRLDDGRVLVIGGWTGSSASGSAELYLPEEGAFEPGGALSKPRINAQATLLTDGRVLVSGGEVSTGHPTRALDLYDPRRSAFSVTEMRESRAFHSATRLRDGRVLIVGGHSGRNAVLRSAEIYDPRTGKTEPTGQLTVPRYKHAAVLLHDDRVLVIAGSGPGPRETARYASSEIFDPATGTFSPGPALRAPRYKIPDAAVVTSADHVVVAGGAKEVEVWRGGSFESVGGGFDRAYEFSTVNLLVDGDVLVVGGYDEDIRPTRQSWRLRSRASEGVAADASRPSAPGRSELMHDTTVIAAKR